MTTSFLNLVEAQNERFRCGTQISYDIPQSDLRDFMIGFENKYTVFYDEMLRCLPGIEDYKAEMYGMLRAQGYWIADSHNPMLSPTLYRNQTEALQNSHTFNVYLYPCAYSGVAPEKDIKILMELLNRCFAVKNVRLTYSRTVYDLTEEAYQAVLEKARPQIECWLRIFLKQHPRYNAGETFSQIFLLRPADESGFHPDCVTSLYVNKLAESIRDELRPHNTKSIDRPLAAIPHREMAVKYAFKCQNCGQIVKRKQMSKFVRDYKLYHCGRCGGNFVPIPLDLL